MFRLVLTGRAGPTSGEQRERLGRQSADGTGCSRGCCGRISTHRSESSSIGDNVSPDFNDPTPIFDQISVWFTAEPDSSPEQVNAQGDEVIDLRGEDERKPSSRWASSGDQRWLATNARAAGSGHGRHAGDRVAQAAPGANLFLPGRRAAGPTAPARPAAGLPRLDLLRSTGAPARSRGTEPGAERAGRSNRSRSARKLSARLGKCQKATHQPSPAPAFDPGGRKLVHRQQRGRRERRAGHPGSREETSEHRYRHRRHLARRWVRTTSSGGGSRRRRIGRRASRRQLGGPTQRPSRSIVSSGVGLGSLTNGAAMCFSAGSVVQTVVEMQAGSCC